YEVINYGKFAVDDHVRTELRVGPGEPVYRLQRLRRLSGRPIAFEIRYMPALTGSRLSAEMLSRHSLQELLADHVGTPISKFHNTVRVALVPPGIARYLDLARTRPVMVRAHTFLDAHGTPLLWGETL